MPPAKEASYAPSVPQQIKDLEKRIAAAEARMAEFGNQIVRLQSEVDPD
jgi:hypothetical protein